MAQAKRDLSPTEVQGPLSEQDGSDDAGSELEVDVEASEDRVIYLDEKPRPRRRPNGLPVTVRLPEAGPELTPLAAQALLRLLRAIAEVKSGPSS